MSRPRLIALLLALVTLVVYLPVMSHDFLTYDDDDYVANNRVVQNGLTWAGVKWAFTSFHAANWHPLTWLSLMADCEFFNLNTGALHFVNVLFHAANTALLFILLLRLTKKIMPATIVAALFAWHPLHVESVAWIAERKDVLSTFFALLAFLSYAKFVQENCRRSFWFALIFFGLGLLAKPMCVTLPFVMLLLDYWPLQRTAGKLQMSGAVRLVAEKIPFFLLAAISCVVTVFAQRAGNAVASLENFGLVFRLANSCAAIGRYLLKIFWPADLAVIYPMLPIPVMTLVWSVIVLLLASLAVWLARLRSPCWLVGWLWFLGTLVPVIGLVQVGSAAMADRYTYIPAIGIFIAIVFGLDKLAANREWMRKNFPLGMLMILSACVMLTEKQLGYWRNSETLFRHALAVTKNNDIAHDNLGVTFERQGRTAEALAEYREAVRINPNHYQLLFSIGNMLGKLGYPAEALAEYRQCLSLDPKVPALHNAAGDSLVALGKLDEALAEFSRAARFDPHYPAPHIGAAKALLLQGHDQEAVAELRNALQIDPDNFKILAYTAHVLAADKNTVARDGENALALALKANNLTTDSQPLVLDILGMAYAETGDFTNAVTTAQDALELAVAVHLTETNSIHERLELYKNHQPWRESFGAKIRQ